MHGHEVLARFRLGRVVLAMREAKARAAAVCEETWFVPTFGD
jgi:hypothetical protein